MLILGTLEGGPKHGYAIARRIQEASEDYLRVEEGSLYPALHRMQRRGWLEAQWGPSESNRRAKFYRLTVAGKAQLAAERESWDRLVMAIAGVMRFQGAEG